MRAIEREAAARFRDPVRAGEIAARVGLHPAYAAALYRRHRGMTITEHLTRLRVNHARELLRRAPGRSVIDTAFESGFGSISRFYEAFRALTGRSPRSAADDPLASAADGPPKGFTAAPRDVTHALWVDDQPQNNVLERRAMASRGIYADTARSNDEAELFLRAGGYRLIVSDVTRTGSRETGWELAERAARLGFREPVIFYCGFIDRGRRDQARRVGAAAICDTSAALMAAAGSRLRSV